MKKLKNPDAIIRDKDPALVEKPQDPKQWRAELANQEVPLPSPQLNALVRSQVVRKDYLLPRRPLRTIAPQVPETNSWGRPTPMKRVRNIKRQWYADTLSRVMPPLPEAEWELLRKRALGKISLHHPHRRRGPSGEGNIGQETYHDGDQWHRPHVITSRYMRRLLTQIFQQCPLMKEDPSKPFGWQIIWSDVKSVTRIGLDSRIAGYKSAFEGVDENGKLRGSGHQ